jgi:glycosyltransferase involved in cell wall biosynthesis
MKVVHLTSVHSPHDGRIFEKECKFLAQLGYEVVLLAPGNNNETIDGVRIETVPKVSRRIVRMTHTVSEVYRRALECNADVYHLHDPELIPIGLLLRIHGKQVVYDVHEDLPRTIRNKGYLPRGLRFPVSIACEVFERLTLRYFTALVAATREIGIRRRRFNPNTFVVNNFPVIPNKAIPCVPWTERKLQVAYVGAITEARGISEIVQAMALLPESVPMRLALAGPVMPPEFLTELSQLDGWKRVDWLGTLDHGQVVDLLAESRAGLVVLHPVPNYVCSWPTKLFEYMLAGLPVIASDFPMWREIVCDAGCGLLVNPLAPAEIAAAIERVFANPAYASEMGVRGHQAVTKAYNWGSEAGTLADLYRRLEPPRLGAAVSSTVSPVA